MILLSTVPTKYGGLCTKLAPCRKSRLASNLNKNADISIFLKKEGHNDSSQISLEFALTYRNVNTFIKISKLLANGNIKKTLLRRF